MDRFCERNPTRVWHPMPKNVRRHVEMQRRGDIQDRNPQNGASTGNGSSVRHNNPKNKTGCTSGVSTKSSRNGAATSLEESAVSVASEKKTKHTVVLHGDKWADVLKKSPKSLKSAFRRDFSDATGLREKRIENLHFEFTDKLVATFIVHRKYEEEYIADLHTKLQMYTFPITTRLCH